MSMIPSSLKLSVLISKQGRRFVAYSPALDISTSGKSERDVRIKFEELVKLFLEELEDTGNTAEVLTELGWKKIQRKFKPPAVSQKNIEVKIPAFA